MCMLQATCMKKGGENANFRLHILLTGKHNSIGNVRLLSYKYTIGTCSFLFTPHSSREMYAYLVGIRSTRMMSSSKFVLYVYTTP